jgi:hypothetical protein
MVRSNVVTSWLSIGVLPNPIRICIICRPRRVWRYRYGLRHALHHKRTWVFHTGASKCGSSSIHSSIEQSTSDHRRGRYFNTGLDAIRTHTLCSVSVDRVSCTISGVAWRHTPNESFVQRGLHLVFRNGCQKFPDL